MAWDEAVAAMIRADLAERQVACIEKRMFGGIAFLHRGHMLAGMHKGGAMFRVGKGNEPAATALPGVRVMQMAGRPMPGMVDCSAATAADHATRCALLDIADGFVATLPDKVAKPPKPR
jgi:TfoX/Sxy family transcriptional regulator of competence genes